MSIFLILHINRKHAKSDKLGCNLRVLKKLPSLKEPAQEYMCLKDCSRLFKIKNKIHQEILSKIDHKLSYANDHLNFRQRKSVKNLFWCLESRNQNLDLHKEILTVKFTTIYNILN